MDFFLTFFAILMFQGTFGQNDPAVCFLIFFTSASVSAEFRVSFLIKIGGVDGDGRGRHALRC